MARFAAGEADFVRAAILSQFSLSLGIAFQKSSGNALSRNLIRE